ncbi:LysM peptidoglycan-binding domain-containing protein [Aquabacterium sp. OR-4]|uniref:LysM peptidoglycan-binding domain-containing protein n=1 Tax=Aquabacterium sp. OR-4 TaxID=2978127 RepID=UPI0021B37501|nr:LysM peptidoglycan-binding domain-containing protein [Aquabacterium sp. OR-4]MDT7837434.1 LysM peptidoglycan-binding domain-containing protein [Aquabacterium sp. OR-4]
MSSRPPRPARLRPMACAWGLLPLLWAAAAGVQALEPVTPAWRATAQQVAEAGVPLSELAANAPDSHTVQRGDTLWGVSSLFLKGPWRWPELWGMNLDQIRNPHLIYPGQVLVLDKSNGRARLRLARGAADGQMPSNTVKLSPTVRSQLLDNGAIASIPLHLIGPFLNEAVVLSDDALATAPRIVATQEGRVMVSRGETAYVRGDLAGARSFAVYRQTKPLSDPETRELLGFEAGYVGTADLLRTAVEQGVPVPATFTMTSVRQEAGVGDRLAPVPPHDLQAYVPHAPGQPVAGRVVSIYGEALSAGQNQIVAINRGTRDGIERGHVLALWRAGTTAVDRTQDKPLLMQLPDERSGLLFVFRVFDRVSYALIVSALDPVKPGDRFTQP